MNSKCVVALILVLQVSMSLCEIPSPSQEFAEKYARLESGLNRQLANLFRKIHDAVPKPSVRDLSPYLDHLWPYLEELLARPEVKAVLKVAGHAGHEAERLVNKARTDALGVYEHYLQSHDGPQPDDIMNFIKSILDVVMPAE